MIYFMNLSKSTPTHGSTLSPDGDTVSVTLSNIIGSSSLSVGPSTSSNTVKYRRRLRDTPLSMSYHDIPRKLKQMHGAESDSVNSDSASNLH